MSGERINYSIERQRHEGFVGREALLDQLDELLTADGADRWVVVTGGPGMGKSALLAAWLARRERAGAVVPHHFIRWGQYDWDDPAKLVSSLVAQLEERHPGVREPEADERIHPAARLAAMLSRVSAAEPVRPGARLVILIDGLDEYDPPAGAAAIDPLAAFLAAWREHSVSQPAEVSVPGPPRGARRRAGPAPHVVGALGTEALRGHVRWRRHWRGALSLIHSRGGLPCGQCCLG